MAFLVEFLCLAVLVTSASAVETTTTFLPTLYVTSAPERPISQQAVVYGATICKGELYHGNLAVVRVNIPHRWDPHIGYIAKIEACPSMTCEKIHCTNYPHKRFNGNHYCNFTYDKAMGDIFVRATAGPSPNIDWTVAVEFVNPKSWVPPPPVRVYNPRFYNYRNWEEPIALNGLKYTQVVPLTQIVKTGHKETVMTRQLKEFFFWFCPDRGTGDRYDVVISTIAIDSKSAMATYVCLPNELPCSVLSSTHYDPRGIGFNSVTLTTGDRRLTNLHVIVVGWGDGQQTNTFELGASITKPRA